MATDRPATGRQSSAGAANRLEQDLIELGGAGLEVVELDGEPPPSDRPASGAVRVGVHRSGPLPDPDQGRFDILLSAEAGTAPAVGPRPICRRSTRRWRAGRRVERQPVAASVAAQVLRMTLSLSFAEALALESIAYSMLLASDGFRTWRAATPVRVRPPQPEPRVAIDVAEAGIAIRLTRPASRNAFDVRMRDELSDALAFAVEHPDAPSVVLSGEGPSFSAGGDLDEFGSAADVGWAHLIRAARSPAGLVHALDDRLTVRVHGACVGAGIEVSAAAARLVARPDARFRLPEVSMGLIPGAGGTASIPRRIGRHRACFMAISGDDIDLETALAWGLVDAVDTGA